MSDSDIVKPSSAALNEAFLLSEELLRNIELSEIPLTNAALKASRLSRLLNEFDFQKIFGYEASGYPTTPTGIDPDVWVLAVAAKRMYQQKTDKGDVGDFVRTESIERLEANVESAKLGIDAARDPNISLSSSNPHEFVAMNVGNYTGNKTERQRLHRVLQDAVEHLATRRFFIHEYVAKRNLELKFSTIASDSFSRIREFVDRDIGEIVPSSVQKFSAIYENLRSDNPEDWSNAVHGCRRVLQDLADAIFPATEPRTTSGKKIILGQDQYINRLVCFAEDHSSSQRSTEIIGSQMSFLGERLDALFQAAQKGSHSVITTREEADHYVVYTYMIVGDLLRLRQLDASPNPSTIHTEPNVQPAR